MGHDSSNAYYCIIARIKREGKPSVCPKCKGTGENWQHPKAKRLYKNWKSYDPPIGEGFQLWETTSEGSPSSPVFETLENCVNGVKIMQQLSESSKLRRKNGLICFQRILFAPKKVTQFSFKLRTCTDFFTLAGNKHICPQNVLQNAINN